jgi:hypothetical protein
MSHQGRDRRWCRWVLRRQKRLVAGKGQPESNLARPDWRISIVSFGTLARPTLRAGWRCSMKSDWMRKYVFAIYLRRFNGVHFFDFCTG